jgi:hypothetical protein
MKMIDVLKKIFISIGFESTDFEYKDWMGTILKPNSDYNNKSFYIVLDSQIASESTLIDLYNNGGQELIELIRDLPCYEPYLDKNSSLIICYSGDVGKASKLIWQLEEDPYIFKKNILRYNDLSVNNLVAYLDEDFSLEGLNRKIMDAESFDLIKRQKASQNGYDLLCNIFIKIPVIRFLQVATNSLHSLSQDIDTALSKQNVLELRNEILGFEILEDLEYLGLNSLLEKLGGTQ